MARISAPAPYAPLRRLFGTLNGQTLLRRVGILLRRKRIRDSERWLILACAPLGAVVGIVVVLLHQVVVWVHLALFRGSPGEFPTIGGTEDQLRIIIVPAAGGLLLGLLTLLVNRFRPRDIIDPVEANAIHGGKMSLADSIRLSLAALISNGGGASLGMEAAYSQIGAGILSFIGDKLRLRRADQRIFVAAGAAAAIAAAFNAPLAGAFYAYELVLGSYSPGALAQVAMASLAGTLVVRGILAGTPIFLVETPDITLHRLDYPLFMLLGLLAGLLGILAMHAVTWCEANLRKLPTPDWMRPAIGGAMLSALALTFPQVLGSGQDAISFYFDTTAPLVALAGLLAFKLIASAVSIGSGFRGGLFSTSLFMGALLGTLVAQIAGIAIPGIADQRPAFMLVGMGTMAAAVIGAPVTMVLLVLEVTGNFNLALGVLAGVIVAATLVRTTFGYSFSTWRFHQRGQAIKGGHDVGWISEITVERMMRTDPIRVPADASLRRLRELVPIGSIAHVFAVDDEGRYVGAIDTATIHDQDLDAAADGLVADDLAGGRGTYLLPGQDVRSALSRFVDTQEEMLPVIESPELPVIVGYLTEAYALRLYAEEMERQRSAELGERDLFGVHRPS